MTVKTTAKAGQIVCAVITSLFCAAASVAQAQSNDLQFNLRITQDCVANAQDQFEHFVCVGKSAQDCMERNPGGETTYGMTSCLSQELDYWDAELNHAYKETKARALLLDQEMAAYNTGGVTLTDTLRQMQRSWISYRDATCAFERGQWGGGTGAGPAEVNCLMNLTGKQTSYLRDSLQQF